MKVNTIYNGDSLDVLRTFPDDCVDCCITSPPYYSLRDYGVDGQIGLEETPEQYIDALCNVFDEVRRVLKPTGTLWLVLGDSYAGSMKGAAKFPDNAMNYKQGTNRGLLGKSAVVKKLGGDSLESYRGLMGGFCEVSQWISDESVRRIADTCYKCDLPDFDEDTVRRFIFLYSEKEPARQADKRLKKKYPSAGYIVMEGYGHGGFQGEQPQQYSEFIRELLK